MAAVDEMSDRLGAFEAVLAAREEGASPAAYVFRLFVAGSTPRSLRAIANLKVICAQYIEGEVSLRVIDVYQQPHLARADDILAVPTLLQIEPGPSRRVIGDLSDTARVVARLNVKALDGKALNARGPAAAPSKTRVKENEGKRAAKTKRGR